MNNYELHIQGVDGVWRPADLGKDNIAFNFQNSDINNIEARMANYTQRIKLPKTPKNVEIFGNINIHDSADKNPYKRYDCRIYSGIYTIAGTGSFAIVFRVVNEIEIVILSGTANFFQLAKEKSINDINLGKIPRVLASTNYNTSDFWFFAVHNGFSRFSDYLGYPSPNNSNLAFSIPFLKLLKLVEKLTATIGYTYSIETVNQLTDYAISLNGMEEIPNEGIIWKGAVRASRTGGGSIGASLYWTIVNAPIDNPILDNPPVNFGNYDRVLGEADSNGYLPSNYYFLQFNVFMSGTLLVTWFSGTQNLNGSTIQVTRQKRINNVWSSVALFSENMTLDGGKTFEIEYDPLADRDYLDFMVMHYTGSAYTTFDFSFNFESKQKEVSIGRNIDISHNLGFDTVFDFIKFFANTFGLLLDVNEKIKTVRFYNYDSLNKENAKKWSEKIPVKFREEVVFSNTNYAQENIIKFNDDETDAITDAAIIPINDSTLALSKEILKIPAQAGQDSVFSYQPILNMANLPLYVFEVRDGVENLQYNESFKFHLVKIEQLMQRTWYMNRRISETSVNVPSALVAHLKAQTLVDKFYIFLRDRILNKYFQTRENLLLTAEDIANLKDTDVVYLEKYGKYFSINKIENFGAQTLTKVDLIKI